MSLGRVFVTGSDGFVGRHLVRSLASRGESVYGGVHGLDPSAGGVEGLPDSMHPIPFDLTDEGSIRTAIEESDPDVVIHLAGFTSVGASWRDPEAAFRLNVRGALRLLREIAAKEDRDRIVLLVGSGEAYGEEGTEEDPLREGMPLRPRSPYGASKAAQEMIGWVHSRRRNLRVVQTRSFSHTGPGQGLPFVLPQWGTRLKTIARGEREGVLETGDLDIVRDFLDVRDVTEAYLALVDTPSAEGVFNVCSGRGYSLRHLADLLQELVGVNVELAPDAARFRPDEIRSLVGSHERITEVTGWSPSIPIRQTLEDLLETLG